MTCIQIPEYEHTVSHLRGLLRRGDLDRGMAKDILRYYDNLRPTYHPCRQLEFGGVLLTLGDIASLVRDQVIGLFPSDTPRRIVLFWSKQSAARYVSLLKAEIEWRFATDVVPVGIRTKWFGERDVRVLDSPDIPNTNSTIVCVDFLIGTGNTYLRMHEYLSQLGLRAAANLVLVNLTGVSKDYEPTLHHPLYAVDHDFWVFGFNSDCCSDGIERGRHLPFLAWLVPRGAGIRDQLVRDVPELTSTATVGPLEN